MKKLIIIVAVLAVLIVGGIIILMQQTKNSDSTMSGMNSMDMNNPKESVDSSAEVDLTGQSAVSMEIKDFAYSKPNIKIRKGTKVTWTNQDSIKHNVILAGTAKGAPTPDEVKASVFAGPLLAKGESYSFTFNEVTSNAYICSPHPYMKGIVNVVE